MGTPSAAQRSSRRSLGGGEAETGCDSPACHRQHAQGGKEEAVEHHVLHAHLVQRQPAPIEARAPEAAGQRAGAVTEKARRGEIVAGFSISIYCRTRAGRGVSLRKNGRIGENSYG
jgi:hypothetical protein